MTTTTTSAATFDAEYTDTFGGQANYSWVRRARFSLPYNSSTRKIMRRAKSELGLTNMRGTTIRYGDIIEFRPYRCCTVLFISVTY